MVLLTVNELAKCLHLCNSLPFVRKVLRTIKVASARATLHADMVAAVVQGFLGCHLLRTGAHKRFEAAGQACTRANHLAT